MKTVGPYLEGDTATGGGGGDAPAAPAAGNPWAGADAPAPEPGQPETHTPPAPPSAPPSSSPPPGGEPAATPPQQPPSDWTPERVAELLRVARDPGPAQPAQMSEEEMNRMLNVAQVSQEDVQHILEGGENAVAAMNRVIQAAVLQARTTAWYQTQMLLKQQQESMAPVVTYYQQEQQNKLTNQFFNEFREFEPDKHMKLLAAVKTSLDAEQAFQGKSRTEGFKLIAERAKELLTASGTPLVPVAAAANGGKPPMAQLSRGAGHGAAAANAAAGASSNTAKKFFGP